MARIDLFQARRGTAAEWTTANPTLAAGEIGLETDTRKLKWGDGATAWVSLSYGYGQAGEGGGGAVEFADLEDATTAEIPTLNTPLANALAAKISTSAVVNDLTTGGTTVPLSAQQGVVLKGLVDAVGGAPAAADISDAGATGILLMRSADQETARTALSLGTAAVADSAEFELAGAVATHSAVTSGAHGITAAAATVNAGATVAAMVDTLGGAAATGTGGIARAASPTFTGTPAAPTAAAATNTTQIATTAHVFAERTNAATLTSKTMSGANNTFSAIPQSAVTSLTTDLAAKYGSANVGVEIQAYDADLAAIAALVPSNDDVLQRKAGAWTNRTLAQLSSDLGITGGADTTVLRAYTALPATDVADANLRGVLIAEGYRGVLIEADGSGVWSVTSGAMTFAEMMAIASPTSGMTVLVSTIDLGGTAGVVTVNAIYTYTDKWRPTHPVRLWGGAGANTVTNSQTSFQDVLEMVPPVGLFFAGSEIWGNIHTTPSGAGTATYVPQLISGSVTCTSNTTVATGSHLRGTPWLWCNTDDTLSSAGTSGGMDDFVQPTLAHNTMSSPFDGSTITLRLGNTFSGTGTDKTVTFDRISLILMP